MKDVRHCLRRSWPLQTRITSALLTIAPFSSDL